MSPRQYYQSLTRSMMITVILVSLMPLLIIAGIAGWQFHASYKDKVFAHLEEVVVKHKQNIDSFLDQKLAEFKVLADIAPNENLKDPKFLEKLLTDLQKEHSGDFVDLGLVDPSGIQLAYAGPFNLGAANYSDSMWFKSAMNSSVFISDVFLGLRGLPHFIVAVMLDDEPEASILRTTIDFVTFNKLVEDVRIGETGQAFIINNKGEFQTTPRSDLSGEIPFLLELVESSKNSGSQVNVYVGDNPITNTETLFLTTPLKDGQWNMVYQQDSRDAFASLYQSRNIALLVLVLGSISIIIMAYLLSRRMTRRIAEADQDKDLMNEQVIEAGKLASVGELAAGIAHEINNPVAIMVEEASWIQDIYEDEDPHSDENQKEIDRALDQIRTQGARCKEITHKLLSFARKTDPTIKEVHLNEFVEEIAALSEQRAKYANVKIITQLSPNIPDIPASPSEIQQVLLNLVNNAIDSMDNKGGNLTITTSMEDDGRILLSVADSGCGIPQANMSRLFDPFFTTKPVGKGTGLGLSIIYGIIDKMGGEIKVRSAVDKGTTFRIHLPTVPDTETNDHSANMT